MEGVNVGLPKGLVVVVVVVGGGGGALSTFGMKRGWYLTFRLGWRGVKPNFSSSLFHFSTLPFTLIIAQSLSCECNFAQ